MSVHTKIRWVGVIVVFLAVISYSIISMRGSESPPQRDTTTIIEDTGNVDPRNTDIEKISKTRSKGAPPRAGREAQVEMVSLTSSFVNARNAEEATSVIYELDNQGETYEALSLAYELNGRCGHIEGFEPPFERTRWAWELIIRYCDNYMPVLGVESGLGTLATATAIKRGALISSFVQLPLEEYEVAFSRFVANATSIYDIRAASTVMEYFGDQGVNLSFDLQPDHLITSDQLQVIQKTALEVYGCERFGGCGAYDYKTLETCVLTGRCDRGWTYMDYLADTMPDSDFQLALEIVAQIRFFKKDEHLTK